jgi:porphyrinogen peroxidase
MMRNMFIGSPEGNYDRLLDFSRAVTGTLFFVPSQPMLESLADGPLDAAGASAARDEPDSPEPDSPEPDFSEPDSSEPDPPGSTDVPWAPARSGGPGGSGSLEIGSMKGASPDE